MPALESLLGEQVQVDRVPGRLIDRQHVAAADALFVRSVTRVDAGLLDGSSVRFVGTATAGTEHIDQQWLQGAGIHFAHAPGANANSVVEYVLSAVAAVEDYLERLLSGGRLGVVGYGHVGKALVARLQLLGIEYRVYDPWLDQDQVPFPATLDDVLQCDVICLHPELTRESPWPSYHLLKQQGLQTLRNKQLLINASRGAVIDNAALLHRISQPSAPQLVLDVWEHEPAISAALLGRIRIGTAHIAGYSLDSKVLASRMLCQALAENSHSSTYALADDPLPVLPPLQLEQASGPADVIRQLCIASYPIERDDRLLREATLEQAPAQAADNFDQLRKCYAERRELAGRKVALGRQLAPYEDLVSALGCHPFTLES
jgi:erythronate-4-phosphate dehydrogenase